MKRKFNQVYQFKITLWGIKPPIWRRIQVPESYSFWDLHVAIQDAMGWDDYHLHEFGIFSQETGVKVRIGMPEGEYDQDVLPGWEQHIRDYFSLENRKGDYVYDFGDDWEHVIELEKILPRDKKIVYPICVKGKRACPPEDCGGRGGYDHFLDAVKDPDHEDHQQMIDWIGEQFDPKHFDKNTIQFDDPDKRWKMTFE